MAIRTMLLCLLSIANGCAPAGFPKLKYSGNFLAINLSDRAIIMRECSGFDRASPEAGTLIPNATKGSHFPPLSEFPAKTTIHWHDETDNQNHEQSLELMDIVPRGVDGETLFEFTADLKWIVRFVPGSEDDGPE